MLTVRSYDVLCSAFISKELSTAASEYMMWFPDIVFSLLREGVVGKFTI